MSDSPIFRWMTPEGRAPRAAFWPVFAPYLVAFLVTFGLNIASVQSDVAVAPYFAVAGAVGLVICTVWLAMLNNICVKRMHDAGVSAFFYGLLFYIMALVAVLKLVIAVDWCFISAVYPADWYITAVADWGLYAFVAVLHVAIIVFTCLPTQAGDNEFGATPAYPGETFKGTSWGGIVEDMLKLILVMGILGYACDLVKRPFAKLSDTDTLVTLMRKGAGASQNDKATADEAMKNYVDELNRQGDDFVNTKDDNGRSLLMWTVYCNYNDPEKAAKDDKNRLSYVELLLSRDNIDVLATDEDGFTAIHWAAWSGMTQSVELLLKKAPQLLNMQDNNGYTPLMLAAMRGNDSTVKALLTAGADTQMKNIDGKCATDLAVEGEAAYSKRDSWMYELVFEQKRLNAYRRTVELMHKGVEAPQPEQPTEAPVAPEAAAAEQPAA